MGHHHQSALEAAEPVLQPGGHLGVQVVGRFVQHQYIRWMDEGRRQGNPLPLAAGESADFLAVVCDTQLVQHGLGLVFVQFPELCREVQEHLLQHRGVVVHHRILGQIADLHVGISGNAALVRFNGSGQNLQKGGFAGAVDADDAGLVPLVQIKVHILKQLAAAEVDGNVFRG